MDSANASAEALRKQISEAEDQLSLLKKQLAQVEAASTVNSIKDINLNDHKWPLSGEEYKRYGRQLIVPSVGIQGIPSVFRLHNYL